MDPLPEGVYYTAHYNWEPWLNLALVGATQMQRARELPSQRGLSKDERAPPSYALFRAEALEPKAGREAAHESTESVKSPVDAADRTCDEKETVGKGPPVKVSGTLLRRAWATSRCAEQLDPKDNLFRLARQGGASLCFPPTRLLPYDFDLTCGSSKSNSASSRAASASHDHSSNPSGTRASANDSSGNNNKSDGNRSSMVSEPPLVPLHGPRQLLKAPLGSGGNGLYFVESDHEVLCVVKGHRMRAEREPHFLARLKKEHGRVPEWSLQHLVDPVRVSRGDGVLRKSQVRAYVAVRGSRLYAYTGYEVRLPHWDDVETPSTGSTTSASTSTETSNEPEAAAAAAEAATVIDPLAHEVELCGGGSARPYNRGRSKPRTERLVLDECPELRGSESAVRTCLVQTFAALAPAIARASKAKPNGNRKGAVSGDQQGDSNEGKDNDNHDLSCTMAVCGVDLMVTHTNPHEASVEIDNSGAAGRDCGISATLCSAGRGPVSAPSFHCVLLEVNNNPALPVPGKLMTSAYSQHVVHMVYSLVDLGLHGDASSFVTPPLQESNIQEALGRKTDAHVWERIDAPPE